MKKLLKAFTLAEVLITLGIVGVVARVTLPSLTMNVQMQTAATSLAKAINTLESANSQILLDKGTKSLGTAAGGNNSADYLRLLGQYMNGGKYNETTRMVTSKDGVAFRQYGLGSRNMASRQYDGHYYMIRIDINGAKRPNKEGKDQFTVYVDHYGSVIPYGGYLYKDYMNTNSVMWENSCPSNKAKKPTSPQACTGAIVDNGYKILYAYDAL